MTRYLLPPAARRDIADIWLYTADRWGVDQADHYVGQIEDDLTKAAAGLRIVQPIGNEWKIRSGHHLCIFAKPTEDEIWVIRILHERMDIPDAT
ncbi:MAG: type II toxin-antitoxin system RelE/ParE family toxin [Sphingopyxis sp.]|uniref:type II toxin-antitoxin system RelE/ParE family toxin n=1 Tax=Sphingopyxis sp. TaxID=1908224 RepID=UPI003D81167A